MKPRKHILYTLLFIGGIVLVSPRSFSLAELALFFGAAVFIDADHYFYYALVKKDWSLKRSLQWFAEGEKKFLSLPLPERGNVALGVYVFHGMEFLFLVFLLSWWWQGLLLILSGLLFHHILDSVDLIQRKISPEKVFSSWWALHSLTTKKRLH